jgi:sarcosine oxidase subunit alpha
MSETESAQGQFRLASGGTVDRATRLAFTFDGRAHAGHRGDTLASALLAHGVHHVARSFKYHRPRGIVSAGSEEPAALVQLDDDKGGPNVRATTIELIDGLVARAQHCWPSLANDAGAIAGWFAPLLPAGFYYKTFMWPPSPQGWLFWERYIRRAAGLGRAPANADRGRYEHRFAHCDVLVVGGGVAGLAAARAAAACGARVIVCNEGAHWGGQPHGDDVSIDGLAWARWVDATVAALAGEPNVTLLARATAVACYDDNLVVLAERADPFAAATDACAERLWKVRAGAVVLATGAHERLVAYPGNDLPGTLLAASAATYVHRYAVKPGSRAVVFTNNDGAYAAARALRAAGVEVTAIVDARPRDGHVAQVAGDSEVLRNAVIAAAHGHRRVSAVDIAENGRGNRRIACDLVCVSGGYNPAVHLWSQSRGSLRFDARIAGFVPDAAPVRIEAAGAARGSFDLADCLREGHEAGMSVGMRTGAGPASAALEAPQAQATREAALQPLWSVPSPHPGKAFVDLLDDVSVADIAVAAREGYTSVEHLKRYTTLGMGPDQGKIGNVTGLALLAQATGRDIAAAGTTTFRAPYTPVTLGAFPGLEHGPDVEPTRYSAMHDWHAAHGASFVNAGLWKRPHSYPAAGESADEAANREARNVRTAVGIVDVSTLGKIEVGGRDAAAFLDRVYANRFDNLAVGRCRYGIMLRDDGMVLDDGTVSRLGERHYLITTTTANAVTVMQRLERLLQVDWPQLEVWLSSVTEQWSAAAVSGPRARDLLARALDIDVSNAAFPFLAVGDCLLRTDDGWTPARLLRVSYSGELAYEVHVAADRGQAMWDALLAAGQPFGVMPYGTEAMSTLRIEKGHVVIGAEIDGRSTADDLGLGKLVSATKSCIGKALADRPALRDPGRWQLVGLTSPDNARIPRGAKLVADAHAAPPVAMQGHVTSWCWSANLQRWIALALLSRGRARHGETLWAVSPLAGARVRVTIGPSCFIDPEGARLRG